MKNHFRQAKTEWRGRYPFLFVWGLCGIVLPDKRTSNWKEVTCKKCLKRKSGYK